MDFPWTMQLLEKEALFHLVDLCTIKSHAAMRMPMVAHVKREAYLLHLHSPLRRRSNSCQNNKSTTCRPRKASDGYGKQQSIGATEATDRALPRDPK